MAIRQLKLQGICYTVDYAGWGQQFPNGENIRYSFEGLDKLKNFKDDTFMCIVAPGQDFIISELEQRFNIIYRSPKARNYCYDSWPRLTLFIFRNKDAE